MEKYLSVADFAEAAGITPQAVYKRLNKDLAPFVKMEGKARTISTEAIKLFKVDKPTGKSTEVFTLQAEVKRLEEELEVKQQENNRLNQLIQQLSLDLAETGKKSATADEIHANSSQEITKLLKEVFALQQLAINPPQPVEEEFQEVENLVESAQPLTKKGFFSRILRR